jgi:hypothetical protein
MTLPNIDFVQKENYLLNKSPLKFELPFVKVSLGRKNESAHIIRKMNNSKKVVRKHLDTLLLTGFEGTYDDVYKATVYIPLNYNINQAINSYGDQVNITSARAYERDYQDLYYRKVQDSDTNIGSD